MIPYKQHVWWNTLEFKVLVCQHGNWNIWKNKNNYCAAIPTYKGRKTGCKASHFGDMRYVKYILRNENILIREF